MAPLFVARMRGRTRSATPLLDRGARVDRADRYGWTPMLMACGRGRQRGAALSGTRRRHSCSGPERRYGAPCCPRKRPHDHCGLAGPDSRGRLGASSIRTALRVGGLAGPRRERAAAAAPRGAAPAP
mmetsp:Transcript_3216/g.9670  ORF Transcript_3216/g.9670 Transcript_3216/m.9670 type:complete len:127 (-) Transcript_3216:2423-2803(-)